MIQIIYGDQIFPNRNRFFLRNVFTESAQIIPPSAAQCADPNAPRYAAWLSGECAGVLPDEYTPTSSVFQSEKYCSGSVMMFPLSFGSVVVVGMMMTWFI